MKYKFQNKTFIIPDECIKASMDNLGLSQDEAIQLWLEDHDLVVNEQQTELIAAASSVKISDIVQAQGDSPRVGCKKLRTPKEDAAKANLFNALKNFIATVEGAGNIEVLTENKLFSFTIGNDVFKVDLIRQRKPKDKEKN